MDVFPRSLCRFGLTPLSEQPAQVWIAAKSLQNLFHRVRRIEAIVIRKGDYFSGGMGQKGVSGQRNSPRRNGKHPQRKVVGVFSYKPFQYIRRILVGQQHFKIRARLSG